MGIRTAQRRPGPVLGLAAFLGLALTFASSPAAAQQWTPEQRAACEPYSVARPDAVERLLRRRRKPLREARLR